MAYNKIIYNGNTLIDLTEDTISQDKVLAGTTFHGVDGEQATGSMPNRGAVSGTIATKVGTYTVPQEYHDGKGSVGISGTEKSKLIAGNIKSGVSLLGVVGSYAGEAINLQSKIINPTASKQTITADAGYDGLSAVTVNAIKYEEIDNTYGTTVQIATYE